MICSECGQEKPEGEYYNQYLKKVVNHSGLCQDCIDNFNKDDPYDV